MSFLCELVKIQEQQQRAIEQMAASVKAIQASVVLMHDRHKIMADAVVRQLDRLTAIEAAIGGLRKEAPVPPLASVTVVVEAPLGIVDDEAPIKRVTMEDVERALAGDVGMHVAGGAK